MARMEILLSFNNRSSMIPWIVNLMGYSLDSIIQRTSYGLNTYIRYGEIIIEFPVGNMKEKSD